MRWEDERYVRFYTRNSPEWLALSWQARALFGLILREVDRAGILKVGKLGRKGVAVAVRAPWAEIEGPLSELLEDGCVVMSEDGQALVMPNFIEAQEAVQSDAARKRKSRETARAQLGGTVSASAAESARQVTKRDGMKSQDVTEGHETGQKVTSGHVESRPVTSGHSVPICAVPNHAQNSLSRAWGKARFSELWIEVVKKTPTGNWVLLDDIAERCALSARSRGIPVELHTPRLLSAFVALRTGWKGANRPCPQPRVEAFDSHFAACEEVVDGERDPKAVLAQPTSPVLAEGPRPRLRNASEIIAERKAVEAVPAPPEFKKLLGGDGE